MISVDFPDFKGCCTSGTDIANALYMAQDVLNLTLYDLEQDEIAPPKASNPKDIKIDGAQFTRVIAADTDIYRRVNEELKLA